MKALVFGVEPEVDAPQGDAGRLTRNLAATPMGLREVDAPSLAGDDWMVLRTRLCGICGSDAKQVLMDYEDEGDNAFKPDEDFDAATFIKNVKMAVPSVFKPVAEQ